MTDKLKKIKQLFKLYEETVYSDVHLSDELNDEGYSYQTVGPYDLIGKNRPHYEDAIAQFYNDEHPGHAQLFVQLIQNFPEIYSDLEKYYTTLNELKPLLDMLSDIKQRTVDIETLITSADKNDLKFNQVWQFADDLKDYSDDLKTMIEGYYGKFDR